MGTDPLSNTRPRLLDLFCGAGGAAMGYHRAGFDVTGVDIVDQPDYPFTFHRGDAMTWPLDGFDVIHASPPCQAFTTTSAKHRGKDSLADRRVDLLTPTLERLRPLTIPWVVENVAGAASMMRTTLLLHGGMFGLGVHRPRLFESNQLILAPRADRATDVVGVYGSKPDGRRLNYRTEIRAARGLPEAQEAMGMDWADWHGTKEAIPPAYTEHIGRQLIGAMAHGN